MVTRPGKRLQKTNWKIGPFSSWENQLLMLFMAIFNSYVTNYQGVMGLNREI